MAQIQEQQPKFDPTTHHFSPEELKPTPIQKKSRKQLVREEDKDEKYWDKVRISRIRGRSNFIERSKRLEAISNSSSKLDGR